MLIMLISYYVNYYNLGKIHFFFQMVNIITNRFLSFTYWWLGRAYLHNYYFLNSQYSLLMA